VECSNPRSHRRSNPAAITLRPHDRRIVARIVHFTAHTGWNSACWGNPPNTPLRFLIASGVQPIRAGLTQKGPAKCAKFFIMWVPCARRFSLRNPTVPLPVAMPGYPSFARMAIHEIHLPTVQSCTGSKTPKRTLSGG